MGGIKLLYPQLSVHINIQIKFLISKGITKTIIYFRQCVVHINIIDIDFAISITVINNRISGQLRFTGQRALRIRHITSVFINDSNHLIIIVCIHRLIFPLLVFFIIEIRHPLNPACIIMRQCKRRSPFKIRCLDIQSVQGQFHTSPFIMSSIYRTITIHIQ